MKKSYWAKVFLGVLTFGIAMVIGCGSDSDLVVDTTGVDKTKSYLFVQTGTSGSFTDDGSGNYTLTIKGVAPQTIYFSDRPERDAGQVPLDEFLTSGCFNSSNPPNAAIDVMNGDENSDVIIVELLDPKYDATTATLQYTAHILKDVNYSIEPLNERRDSMIPETFGAVALFIDDCPDKTITCGDANGNEAGKTTCCTCWSWDRGCDFQSDCCSFERCQNNCTSTFGSEYSYLRVYCFGTGETHWVNNVDDWEKWIQSCPVVP